MPTEHYIGRQTSFLSAPQTGDHSADISGAAFALHTTSRYFLDELDVTAPDAASGVVAVGDSITDGYQPLPLGLPESPQGLDADARWPDDLERRILAAGLPFSVLNAGISGNRILQDGTAGGGPAEFGPSALSRLQTDAIDLPGVSNAIVLEGINDLGGGSPTASPQAVIDGLRRVVARLHAAGLHVLLGTLTPTGGALVGHGTAAENAGRETVNAWIRAQHVADAVVDFDVAVRDPTDPSRINPAYDGGDHVHFNPNGYGAMANAIPLAQLLRPACSRIADEPRTVPPPRPALVVSHPARHGQGGRVARRPSRSACCGPSQAGGLCTEVARRGLDGRGG
jgi:lysophospholipase L1-like esterase